MMQNDVATSDQRDTELTRERSPDVHPSLITARKRAGYKTPKGRLLSVLSEQLLAREIPAERPWIVHPYQTPGWMIERTMRPAYRLPKGDR
jgi:hypothetical protein